VVSEQPFWSALCSSLGQADLADLAFVERRDRADELQARLSGAIRDHGRDQLVATLLSAGVPVAPVRTRAELRRDATVPTFPIRSGLTPSTTPDQRAPGLDQHGGRGWRHLPT
jgi:crotonobetainyl-CoA:carnitine CoA-transferase CaiB-like acyl-CoA transferase